MSDGLTPIIVFSNGSPTGSKILYTDLSNIVAPDVGYDFTPTNDDTVPSHYTNTGSSYEYSYTPPTPPVVPNVFGFVDAIVMDITINNISQMGLAAWYPQLQMFVTQPALIQAAWAHLVATYGGSWLDPTTQTTVQGYATEFNVPLMA